MSSVLCKPAAKCFFYHTPRQLPPHDTGHRVKTVTLGWVGAPNELIPFRIHDATAGFLLIVVCRGLGISPLRTQRSAWVFLKPMLAQPRPQICFVSGFSKGWHPFCFFYVAHRKRVLKLFIGYRKYLWNSKKWLKLSLSHWHRSKGERITLTCLCDNQKLDAISWFPWSTVTF